MGWAKKGMWYFGPILAIVTLIVMIGIISSLQGKYNELARERAAGDRALSLLSTYYEGEKALAYIDSSATFASNDAAVKMAANGGFYEKTCGTYQGFALWKKDCKPDSKSNFQLYLNDRLIPYLQLYYLIIPQNNYVVELSQDSTLHITGYASQRLAIGIYDIKSPDPMASIVAPDLSIPVQTRTLPHAEFAETPGGIAMFSWPLDSGHTRITSCVGLRTRCTDCSGNHGGVDIKGAIGDQVYAALGGEVASVGGAYGIIAINHEQGYVTSYMHLSKYYVSKGDKVEQGQAIGEVGVTGTKSSHLHFQITNSGSRVDPLLQFDLAKLGLWFESASNCVYNSQAYSYADYVRSHVI